jgi:methylated-DNA-[protein]-cysteine S-methyltransferase
MIHRTSVSGCRTTKIYCRPDCPPGRRTKPENRVYFRSIAEAKRKGYRACKVCKPEESPKGRETIFITRYDGPLGEYFMASSKDGVVCLKTKQRSQKYLKQWQQDKIVLKKDGLHTRQLKAQLDRYFRGKLRRFAVPLDLRGSAFQCRVWKVLGRIPYGETRSYREIAEGVGLPKAARAIGRAVGSNPISIVIPCHRVIGSNGALIGYGGGLDRKAALLRMEDCYGSSAVRPSNPWGQNRGRKRANSSFGRSCK